MNINLLSKLKKTYADLLIWTIDNDVLSKLKKKYANPANYTKNQHYVPKFYLKKFANSVGKLETFDMTNQKILKPQSPSHVCSWDYFYALETWKKDDISQVFEEMFDYFENDFSLIYDELIQNIYETRKIKEDLLYALCQFVAVSRLRGKSFRNLVQWTIKDIIKQISIFNYRAYKANNPHHEMVKKISSDKKLEDVVLNWEFDIELNNAWYIKFMADDNCVPWWTNLFLSKKIRIFISNGERKFVTSDSCVVELFPEIASPYGVSFYERIHYFVLSPDILIEFSDPFNKWKEVKRKRIGKQEVLYYNLLRSMYSSYMYSNSQDNFIIEEYSKVRFQYIDKLCKLFPTKFQDERNSKLKIEKIAEKVGVTPDMVYDSLKYSTRRNISTIVKNVVN